MSMCHVITSANLLVLEFIFSFFPSFFVILSAELAHFAEIDSATMFYHIKKLIQCGIIKRVEVLQNHYAINIHRLTRVSRYWIQNMYRVRKRR